jgi:hypothetical protein
MMEKNVMQCKQHPCQAHYHDYDACGFLRMSVQGYCCTDSSNSAAASSKITIKMHIYAMVGGFECVDFELPCCSDAVMPCPSVPACSPRAGMQRECKPAWSTAGSTWNHRSRSLGTVETVAPAECVNGCIAVMAPDACIGCIAVMTLHLVFSSLYLAQLPCIPHGFKG